MKNLIFALSFLFSLNAVAGVYQVDDRKNVADSSALAKRLARSVAVMIDKKDMKKKLFSKNYKLNKKADTLGKEKNLCRGEAFYDEPSVGICTAFLVAPDKVATSGHCVEWDVLSRVWVFDYQLNDDGTMPQEFRADQVYKAKSVLVRVEDVTEDYAIVQLDRPVAGNRTIFKLSNNARLSEGDRMMMIGAPSGLPLKVLESGKVSTEVYKEAYYFDLDFDSFQGNSGSPIINLDTLEVEGILFTNQKDYVQAPGKACYQPNVHNQINAAGASKTSYLLKTLRQKGIKL